MSVGGHLKFTRDSGHGYKDKYWVADLEKGALECYKNDSDAVPQFSIQSNQIQSVVEEVDRQNKFFDFRLNTTGKEGELFFRSQSQHDRDKWIQAINSLILNKRNNQLLKQFSQAIEGRCDDAAQRLSLERGAVAYAGAIPLTQVPNPLWQCYIAAIEEAIRVAEGVVRHPLIAPYQEHRQLIRTVALHVINGYQPGAPQSRHEGSSLTIVVTLLAAGRSITYEHEEVDAIALLALSTLDASCSRYTPEPPARGAMAAICDFLKPEGAEEDEQRDFVIKYRYSDGTSPPLTRESSFARRYLAHYVTPRNLTNLLNEIKRACASNRTDGAAEEHHSDSQEGLSLEAQMLENLTPLQILQEMLDGVIFEIPFRQPIRGNREEDMIREPPSLFAIRKHEEGRIEMTLVRTRVSLMKFHGSASPSPYRELSRKTLGEQLQEIILQVQIASQCSIAEERINQATGFREPCIVDWGGLMGSVARGLAEVGTEGRCEIPPKHLPAIIRGFGNTYCDRIGIATDFLKAEQVPIQWAASNSLGVEALTLFERGFLRCIAGNTIHFKFGGKPSLAITRALLGEVTAVHLALPGEDVPGALLHWTSDLSLPFIYFQFSANALGEWLRNYFLEHGVDDVAPQFDSANVLLDNGKQNEEHKMLQERQEAYLKQQEKVAIARSSENSALRMMDITRIVSDRQRQLHSNAAEGTAHYLLASDSTITSAVHALDRCFAEAPSMRFSPRDRLIDKQDIVKVLNVSLLRLRLLVKHMLDGAMAAAGDGEATPTTLNAVQATSVLRNFCDYSQSENWVQANFTRGEYTNLIFTFDDLASLALVYLLPKEIQMATQSRRNVLVIGLESSGKTTIINHIRHQSGRETLATIGIAETFVAHEEWVFAFKELGGRVDFRKNWREYFKTLGKTTIHGVIVVVNAQDTKRFGEVRDFSRDVVTDRMCSGVPVLFVFNNFGDDDNNTSVGGSGYGIESLPTSLPQTGAAGGRRLQQRSSAVGTSTPTKKSRRYTEDQIKRRLEVKEIASGHAAHTVCCNITRMSSDETIDHRLGEGLAWFCDQLSLQGKKGDRPVVPKGRGDSVVA